MIRYSKRMQPINHNKQIEQLNAFVRTKIAPSPIHGVGLFALRKMKAGEKLYSDMMPIIFNLPYKKFHKLHREIQELLLGQWPQIVNGSIFAFPSTRLEAYINHSENANYDTVNDVLLKDVADNEEITEDYTKIQNYEFVFPWLKKNS